MVTTLPPINEPERRATQLTQRLIDDLRESRESLKPTITTSKEPLVADVESEVEDLRTVLFWSESYNSDIPCIRQNEDTIPILAIPFLGNFRSRVLPAMMRPPGIHWDPFVLKAAFESTNLNVDDVIWTKPSEVPDMVSSPLKSFLQVRFEWLENNPEFRDIGAAASHHASNPYLPVTVHTHTSGLRIHYSKSFVMNFSNVFGAPTSPVKGWLLPGIHKFAGMDTSGTFHYDKGTFTTPPDHVVSLMI